MQARTFNKIILDKTNQTILKFSQDSEKLRDEINYYLNIPSEIMSFFPEMLSYTPDWSSYRMEFIPYNNLSDLIVANKISYEEGVFIINQLINILEKIHATPKTSKTKISIRKFCVEKTLRRVNELNNIDYFEKFLQKNIIKINNEDIENFELFKQKLIDEFINTKINDTLCTVIHGDFCFSNILYCPIKNDIKLVDPRGSFNSTGIYGHPYYDYAKLLHCLHGEYDYILNEHFDLIEKDNFKFYLSIHSSQLIKKLRDYFLLLLKNKGIDLNYLFLIEGTLFISMASLHYESLQRQKVLFLKGLIILNEVLKKTTHVERRISNACMY